MSQFAAFVGIILGVFNASWVGYKNYADSQERRREYLARQYLTDKRAFILATDVSQLCVRVSEQVGRLVKMQAKTSKKPEFQLNKALILQDALVQSSLDDIASELHTLELPINVRSSLSVALGTTFSVDADDLFASYLPALSAISAEIIPTLAGVYPSDVAESFHDGLLIFSSCSDLVITDEEIEHADAMKGHLAQSLQELSDSLQSDYGISSGSLVSEGSKIVKAIESKQPKSEADITLLLTHLFSLRDQVLDHFESEDPQARTEHGMHRRSSDSVLFDLQRSMIIKSVQ